MDLTEVEDHIFAHQGGLLREKFGEEVEANYGWGITSGDEYTRVETKVYKHNVVLITTVLNEKPYDYADEWEPYR